jgi:hypothetical protein
VAAMWFPIRVGRPNMPRTIFRPGISVVRARSAGACRGCCPSASDCCEIPVSKPRRAPGCCRELAQQAAALHLLVQLSAWDLPRTGHPPFEGRS